MMGSAFVSTQSREHHVYIHVVKLSRMFAGERLVIKHRNERSDDDDVGLPRCVWHVLRLVTADVSPSALMSPLLGAHLVTS